MHHFPPSHERVSLSLKHFRSRCFSAAMFSCLLGNAVGIISRFFYQHKPRECVTKALLGSITKIRDSMKGSGSIFLSLAVKRLYEHVRGSNKQRRPFYPAWERALEQTSCLLLIPSLKDGARLSMSISKGFLVYFLFSALFLSVSHSRAIQRQHFPLFHAV